MIRAYGDSVKKFYKKINMRNINNIKPDFIISDRYKFIINDKICRIFKNRIINLHPSFLPYCRGSHPIFFSVYKRRPIGITIHILTKKLDGGPILLQKKIKVSKNTTLRDLYKKIRREFYTLLKKNWVAIKKRKIKTSKQTGKVTEIFKKKEFKNIFVKKKYNYDMRIQDIHDRSRI